MKSQLNARFLWRRMRTGVGVVCLYFLLALSRMGPMASDDIVPFAPDHANHSAIIVQARMAMEEGQFPLRVAPWQHNGYRYPEYQFYNSLPYIVGGSIYRFVTPSNPFLAYKITLLLFITLGGVFVYRTARFLTGSAVASLLAGAAYVFSPYLSVNLLIRAAFAEVVAQGVMPATLYYCLRCCCDRRWRSMIPATLWLVFLAASHLITFVFATVFLGVLLGVLILLRFRRILRMHRLVGAYLLAAVMMSYWLAPVLLFNKAINVSDYIGNPMGWNLLTPLSSLLGPGSAMSEPQPGRSTTFDLNPAVGWPILAAVGAMLAFLLYQRSRLPRKRGSFVIVPLLCVFVLSLFATWSPVDFWKYLPKAFEVLQFSYRLLTYVMWSGSLLLAFAVCAMFRKSLDFRHMVVGLVILGGASGSYVHTLPRASLLADDIKNKPDLGYSYRDFLVNSRKQFPMPFARLGQLPTHEGWLVAEQDLPIFCPDQAGATLRMQGRLPEDMFKIPVTLTVLVDGVPVNSSRIAPGPFNISVNVPIPAADRQAGKPFNLSFRSDNPLVLRDDKGNIFGKYALQCQSMLFDNDGMIFAEALESGRTQKGTVTECKVNLDRAATVQLPILFYPRMIEMKVDGKKADYFPTTSRVSSLLVLAGLDLPAGEHRVTVEFVGLHWANYLSLAGWTIFAILAIVFFARRVKHRRKISAGMSGELPQ